MSQNQFKAPKPGGAARIKETFEKRKRKPSKALLEILKRKPAKKPERTDKKVAQPRRQRSVEL